MSTTITRTPWYWTTRSQATSARLNNSPLGFIGYSDNQGTSQGDITSSAFISDCTVTVPVINAGRMIRVTGHTVLNTTTASLYYEVDVTQNGTTIGIVGRETGQVGDFITSDGFVPIYFPTAATNVVFRLKPTILSGTGHLVVQYTTPDHSYIMVEDLGAAA